MPISAGERAFLTGPSLASTRRSQFGRSLSIDGYVARSERTVERVGAALDGVGAVRRRLTRKVERLQRSDAERDLDELLALRADHTAPEHRRRRQATFADVIDAWFEAGCPNATPTSRSRHVRVKSPNTVATAGFLLDNHVRPRVGRLVVDRATTQRLEGVFRAMASAGYATSTIDRTCLYLNQACQLAVRQRRTKVNPAADVLLPPSRPAKVRKSLTIEQAQRLLVDAIPTDAQPAMWLTGLMCGLRPASWPACAGRTSTWTAPSPRSRWRSGHWRSATATPGRLLPRPSGAGGGSACTRCWWQR